jgi:hypothetical protein
MRRCDSTHVNKFLEMITQEDKNLGRFRHDEDQFTRLKEFCHRHISKVVAL